MKKLLQIFFLLLTSIVYSQQLEFEVFNTSINSKYAELGVSYLGNNTVVFASSKKVESDKNFTSDRRKTNKQLFIDLYIASINNASGDLVGEKKFTTEVNNRFYVSDVTFSPDIKTTYFTWNNYYNTTSRLDSTKWQKLHIVKADINSNFEISNVTVLPFNSEEYTIKSPELSKDGKKLYFVSDMPNGYGNSDIYVVDINNDGTYSKPRNLGPNINTSEAEEFPHIDENNIIYFSSYGHNSKGGFDIFRSKFKDGEYQKTERLPDPINTKFDDFAFVINNSSNTGYFTSTRKGGKGDADIYGFTMTEKEIECTQLISGLIIDEESKKPISDAIISIFENDELINSLTTNKSGIYSFNLKCNSTYKITSEKEHFLNSELEIITDETFNNEIQQNIELTPIECVQVVSGTVTNKITKDILDNISVKLYENGEVITSKNTLLDGAFSFSLKCNSNYSIIADKDGFNPTEIKINTTNIYDYELSKNIELIPLECNQLLAGTITNKLTGETLINANFKLYLNNNLVKTVKLSSDGKFRFELSCNETYKIIAEKEGFENADIEIFTTNDRDLNINTNIELTPIICNQLISGIVSNKTTNEPLTQITLNLFQNNNLVESQLVESNGNYNFKVECNSTYKIVAEKDGFETTEIDLNTSSENDFNQVKNIALIPLKCIQTITGIIIDENTKERLNNLDISLYENNILKETITLRSFEFQFNVDCNKTYKIVVDKINYTSNEIAFTTDAIRNFTNEKSISLSPLECFQHISGTVVDFTTNLPISNAIVSVYTNDVKLETLVVDKNGFFKIDLSCIIPYKLMIFAPNYKINNWDIITTNNYNETFNKTIYLNPEEEFEIIGNIKMIKTNPIDFDLDKAEITPLTAIELEKVYSILIKNPTLKVLIKSHTDSRAPDSYNLSLSQKRAESIVNYLVSKGIDSSRLTAKGMGETELLNYCKNGAKCTEFQHQQNRRTEFVIIQ